MPLAQDTVWFAGSVYNDTGRHLKAAAEHSSSKTAERRVRRMRSPSLAALAALLALSLQALLAGGQLLPTFDDLPVPTQESQRVLATITCVHASRTTYLQKRLQSYTEACELGYEVHVVLVALYAPDASKPEEDLFVPPTLFYCQRLEQMLPVALHLHNGTKLAAQHRAVIAARVDMYDLFISQEEDMDVRPSHLHYYQHWLPILNSEHPIVPVLPTFVPFEVIRVLDLPVFNGAVPDTSAVPKQDIRRNYHPMATIHHNGEHWVALINNTICIAPFKAYSMFWIAHQSFVKATVAKDYWLTDQDMPWREYNPHFQGLWLSREARMVIPLQALRHSLVHHGSDRYQPPFVALTLNASHPCHDNHLDVIAPQELEGIVAHCVGPALYQASHGRHTPLAKQWWSTWSFNVSYSGPDPALTSAPTPCGACLNKGMVARIKLTLKGPSPTALQGAHTSVFARVECENSIIAQFRELCSVPGKCGTWDW